MIGIMENKSFRIGRAFGFFIAEAIFFTILFFILVLTKRISMTLINYSYLIGIAIVFLVLYILFKVRK